MNNLSLVEFNDLFVIAVGLSMTYIVIESKQTGKSFFSILSKITQIVQTMILDYKAKPQLKEEAVISQIKYYLSTNKLKEQTVGALSLVCDKAEEVMQNVNLLEEWIKRKMEFHTKTDFLSVISYDSFVFGMFVLFIGALQNKCQIQCNGLLEWMLLAMMVSLIHCLVYERLEIDCAWKEWTKPNIFTHSVVLAVCLTLGIIWHDKEYLGLENGWIAIMAVVACLIGFLSYLITTVIANVLLLIATIWKIVCLNIDSKVKSQLSDINRYQKELDDIEKAIKEEDIGGQMAFDGTAGVTAG